MKIISFVCYKSYFYFLVYWLSEFCINFSKEIYFSDFIYIKNKQNYEIKYINLLCLNISDLLAGFLVLYTKFSVKNIHIKKEKSKNEIEYIYNKPKKNEFLLLLIIFTSLLDFISRSVFFLFDFFIHNEPILERYEMNYLTAIDIIFRYFFSRIILKTKLYRHHIWSIVITSLGFLFISIIDIITIIVEKRDLSIYYNIFIIPRYILFPLTDVLNKILLSNTFLLPHSLMFYRGLIQSVFLIIITILLICFNKISYSYLENGEIALKIFITIAYIIIASIKAFCLMKVIYIYTAQYVSFLIVVESISGYIVYLISGKASSGEKFVFVIIKIIFLLIISFGTLMYNEIIIIKLFGLQENTKANLLIKEKKDFNETMIQIVSQDNYVDSDDENDEDDKEKN